MPARYQNALENPATVSAVYEDLKSRWNQKRIFEAVKSTKFDVSVDLDEDYPWANLTTMVPGEADVECARISRSTGCSILTNDSDLLIHDLGTGGSVVFLNAMEMNRYDPSNPQNSAIKSVRLSPSTLARQLGVPNLRRFAFELNRDPHLSQAELIQRSRDPRDAIPDYHTFAEEYQIALDRPAIEKQSLDARVSELFWQYDAQGTYAPDRVPHMYLGILNEDHARKCAWEQGRSYRNLGYSILNTHSPAPGMCTAIYEHIRRGGRIAVDQISLSGGEQLMTEVKSVTERLTTARTVFNDQFSSPTSWRVFAMCEVYGSNTTQVCLPDANQLDRFFRLGYMGKQLGWPDMHTFAEIQAVLYSLRILKQLLNVSDALDSRLLNLRSILASLPPLHVLMRSRYEVTLEFPTYTAHGFESRFYQLSERLFNMRPPEQASQQQASPSRDGSKRNAEPSHSGRQPQRRKDQLRSANIFDLLQ